VHLHQDFKDSPALQADNSHQEKYERNKTLFRETISELAFHSNILSSKSLEEKINTANILSRSDVIGMLSEYRKELHSNIKNSINSISPANNTMNSDLSSTLTDIVLLSEELKNIKNNATLNNDVVQIGDFSPALLLDERRLALEKQLKDKKSELLKEEAILIQDLTSKKNELQLVSQHLLSSTDNQKTITEKIKCSTLTSEIEETKKLLRHCLTVLYLTNQNSPLTGKTPPTIFPETYSLISTAYDGIHNEIEAYGELSRILTLDKINHSEVIAINKIAKKLTWINYVPIY
jgi:hypothetical protein